MFKVGDKVRYKDGSIRGPLEVLAIESEYVWVKEINGSHSPYTELAKVLILDTIEIGDKVRGINGSGAKYTVIGKHEGDLWVLTSNSVLKHNLKESMVEKV